MDGEVCHNQDSNFISPQLWIVLFASTEITLLTVNFACEYCCNNAVIVTLSWALAFMYVVFIFVGTNIGWYQCLVGDHFIGPLFIVCSLLSGVGISFRNVSLIDLMYQHRVKSGRHAVVDVYEELCV